LRQAAPGAASTFVCDRQGRTVILSHPLGPGLARARPRQGRQEAT
jgi:hypothetical protein